MNITEIFKNIRNSREQFINLLEALSLQELNQIPDNFKNNVIWNFGHIVITTPILCYKRTGIDTDIQIPYLEYYCKNSKPSYFVEEKEIEQLKNLAKTSIDQIERDYQSGRFENVESFNTDTYKLELNNIEEVLLTTLMHDNLHYGYALAQRKFKKS